MRYKTTFWIYTAKSKRIFTLFVHFIVYLRKKALHLLDTSFYSFIKRTTFMMNPQRYTSLLVQAVYVILTGLQLIFVPNMLLGMFGFDATSEIWIKALGIVVLPLSAVYYAISKQGNREVVFSTIISRGFVGIGFVLLVLSGQAQTSLILFAGIDIATAVWTWLELKKRA